MRTPSYRSANFRTVCGWTPAAKARSAQEVRSGFAAGTDAAGVEIPDIPRRRAFASSLLRAMMHLLCRLYFCTSEIVQLYLRGVKSHFTNVDEIWAGLW